MQSTFTRDSRLNGCTLTEALRRLAKSVRAFQPTVVVLVARKMPRLGELFELDFGNACIVITDLAIPFAHDRLRGARVAIIDDLVNVGTTILRAHEMVTACGSAEVKMFAAGHRNASLPVVESMNCDFDQVLDDKTYADVVDSLPAQLHAIAKPYDLEFPIVRCQLNPPYSNARDFVNWLRDKFGVESVHELTPGDGLEGIRITLDIGNCETGGISKFRFYFSRSERFLNAVAIAIPNCLSVPLVASESWTRRLLAKLESVLTDCPKEVRFWSTQSDSEPNVRARMFIGSLDLAINGLKELAEVCSPIDPALCSVVDAKLLFGPAFSSWLSASFDQGTSSVEPQHESAREECTDRFPFFTREVGQVICKRLCERNAKSLWQVFYDLFDLLGEMVGASEPGDYCLNWPFSKADVQERPYMRLRIGPTFSDLVRILRFVTAETFLAAPDPHIVSAMLDFAIDSGFVVPTLTVYDGFFFRIYRKGESSYHDKVVGRVLYAWRNCGKPMSRTRLTKLLAVLSYSKRLSSEIWPATIERGNVATFQASCIDEEDVELSRYLRDNGFLRRVGGANAGSLSTEG